MFMALFGCFAGVMFVMGYFELHDKKELKQGLVTLICSLVFLSLCCLYFFHWEKSLILN